MSLVKIVMLATIGLFGLQSGAELLGDASRVSISGPIEVRLSFGETAEASFDTSVIQVEKLGDSVVFSSTRPAQLHLRIHQLEALEVTGGELLIKLEGSERLRLGQIIASDIRISLLDRARLESDQLEVRRLQISLSDQGKAALLNVVADVLELELTDHSDIELSGETREQDIDIRGYSHYDGAELKSDQATIALDDYAAGYIQARQTPSITSAPFASLSTRLTKQS
jgi:hypothetical protein